MVSKIPTRDGNYELRYLAGAAGNGSFARPWFPVHAIAGPVAPTPLPISIASTASQTIIAAPGAGYRIRVTFLKLFSLVGDFLITVKSGANLIGYAGGRADVADYIQPMRFNENEALILQSNTADQIHGQVCYYIEEVPA
jgi:hypothetical protein